MANNGRSKRGGINAWVCVLAVLLGCGGGSAGILREDCTTPGDEDRNGAADCEDLTCRASALCQVCGDGNPTAREMCDDGNAADDDGCDHNCTRTACGNGVVTTRETCDDGNLVDGDGCDHSCTPTACGNGIVTAGEACDDGNLDDHDGCARDCKPTGCGNGFVTAGEACDDGNLIDGDGCDHDCSVSACGNGIAAGAEDCDDGNAADDDGCARCRFAACPAEVPVAPGAGGSFPLAGDITKLLADPASCFLYALDAGSPSSLVVISTASKRVLTRVVLFEDATDAAISPLGDYLVVGHATSAISIIDRTTWTAASRVPTFAAPASLAMTDRGIAFYGQVGFSMHRIDLRDGTGDGEGFTLLSSPQLALSRDGNTLYVGEWGRSGGHLVKYSITGGTLVVLESNTMGFDYPARHAYVSPGGQHVYYAGHQFDAAAIGTVHGSTGERIFAEDAAGTFAVGEGHVFDAALVRPVAALPQPAGAAALTTGDRELWYHSPETGRLYYVAPQDLIGERSGGAVSRATERPKCAPSPSGDCRSRRVAVAAPAVIAAEPR